MLEDVVDAGALDGTTGIHDEDVVGRAGHHAQIVGDEHDGGAGLLLRLGEHVEDLRLNRHVEAVVGSSAMMTSGLFAMAMAIITR